jgi:hypothetical protein
MKYKEILIMKVQEFIDYMKKNTNTIMKEDQVLSLVQKVADVKQYIGIKEKKQLVDKIINECIYYDNNVYRINGLEKYIYFTMYTIEAYTNLELDADVENDFDLLSEAKLLPVLICAMQQEYDEVSIYLQMQCDFILENNSLEALVGEFFNDILDTIGTFENKLSKYVDNIDMDKLFNSELVGKLMNFIQK